MFTTKNHPKNAAFKEFFEKAGLVLGFSLWGCLKSNKNGSQGDR
jgi:hypothetical protein